MVRYGVIRKVCDRLPPVPCDTVSYRPCAAALAFPTLPVPFGPTWGLAVTSVPLGVARLAMGPCVVVPASPYLPGPLRRYPCTHGSSRGPALSLLSCQSAHPAPHAVRDPRALGGPSAASLRALRGRLCLRSPTLSPPPSHYVDNYFPLPHITPCYITLPLYVYPIHIPTMCSVPTHTRMIMSGTRARIYHAPRPCVHPLSTMRAAAASLALPCHGTTSPASPP